MTSVMSTIMMNLPLFLCLLAGIILLVLEVFLPGFGLPGFSGLCLIVAGICMTLQTFGATAAFMVGLITAVLAAVAIAFSLRSATKGRLSRSALFLRDTEYAGEVKEPEQKKWEGKSGKTVTVLSPAGFVEIDGERLNVVSEGEYLQKDVEVTVISEQGNRIVVRRAEA